MYIARIRVKNFRCFRDIVVDFQPGVNVIIGENNSGKTTLLKALMLVFGRRSRVRPTVHDFYRLLDPLDAPPTITVEATIRSSPTDTPADRALVASWLTRLDPPWEAQLTYSFFLPEQHHADFQAALQSADRDHFFDIVDEFLLRYVSRIYAGNPETKLAADHELLAKFDSQFLDALRDVEAEMFGGGTPLFRSMLEEVLDLGVDPHGRRTRRQAFRAQADTLRTSLVNRLDVNRLFRLVTETGAADGGRPTLSGAVDEADLMAALRLFVEREHFAFPASHNGLGYNNLIYISLVLANLSFRTSTERLGQNAAIFPMLLIEEPEAHLHPALQHKLLSHIVSRVKSEPHQNRQVFVTTHSTHITAAAGLEPIICFSLGDSGNVSVTYPARLYEDTPSGRESRGYVERYLDATKSAMLFAKATLLVEGIAEQLVLPAIAKLLGKSFDTHHVAVVRVDGVTFKHFLPLFGAGVKPELQQFALNRRIACLVDADPSRRLLNSPKARFKSCYPFQLDKHPAQYTYRAESGTLVNLRDLIASRNNLRIFSGAKTFEYDLALANMGVSCITTDAMESAAEMRTFCSAPETLPPELEGVLLSETLTDIEAIVDAEEKKRHRFATVYLACAADTKGAHAFALERALGTLASPLQAGQFVIPSYVKAGIEWVVPDA